MPNSLILKALTLVALALCWTSPLQADGGPASAELKTVKIADGLYVIMGRGGNIGVSVGKDATFIIDDKYAEMHEDIVNTVAQWSDKPIKFVINTHWHGDHTGGNELLGKRGANIIAHANVRKLMSADQVTEFMDRKTPAAANAALPVITFTDEINLHLNGDDIKIKHVKNAHTNGDSIVHFTKKNVIHTGDIFFNGLYPFIDYEHGGTIEGMINAVDHVLSNSDNATKIIPGHGPPASKADLQRYRDMLQSIGQNVAKLKSMGKSLEQTISAEPSDSYDEANPGFLSPEQFVTLVYRSLP